MFPVGCGLRVALYKSSIAAGMFCSPSNFAISYQYYIAEKLGLFVVIFFYEYLY
jgi:hypothetical protein